MQRRDRGTSRRRITSRERARKKEEDEDEVGLERSAHDLESNASGLRAA